MSAFLGLTDAVRDALLANPALAGGNVQRGRGVPLPAGSSQGIDVSIASSRAQPLGLAHGSVQWESVVIVTCKARASAATDAEAAIDPLLVAAWQRLLAMTVPEGVSGMVLDPAIQWDIEEADQPVAAASLALRITHITNTAALAAS
ncbi:MAG: hypothetical protein IPM99_18800 [Rubrivivax sp.]|nr:hypothetical protein [Rubrivivax sp.]